ncbi:proteasome regulatory particle subunit [Conglomerata obtusa]
MEFNFSSPTLEVLSLLNDKESLTTYIKTHNMLPYYVYLTQQNILPFDKNIQDAIQENITKQISELQSLKKFESDEDDQNIDIKISECYASFLDHDKFHKTSIDIRRKNASSSLAMDIILCSLRSAIIYNDSKLLAKSIKDGNDLLISGCDWDRRNKFKAYEGLYFIITKNYKKAGALIFESIPVYECKELLPYNKIVLYALFSYLVSFEREDLKSILSSSDVLETSKDNEKMIKLTECVFNCKYDKFFTNLIDSVELIKDDIFLKKRIDFFVRELKIRVYKQLLLSYKSLSLEMCADLLKVNVDFVERDLCDFIVDQRIKCVIDKVSGLVYVKEVLESKEKLLIEKGDLLMETIRKNIN